MMFQAFCTLYAYAEPRKLVDRSTCKKGMSALPGEKKRRQGRKGQVLGRLVRGDGEVGIRCQVSGIRNGRTGVQSTSDERAVFPAALGRGFG
jgi:hypothetical protein